MRSVSVCTGRDDQRTKVHDRVVTGGTFDQPSAFSGSVEQCRDDGRPLTLVHVRLANSDQQPDVPRKLARIAVRNICDRNQLGISIFCRRERAKLYRTLSLKCAKSSRPIWPTVSVIDRRNTSERGGSHLECTIKSVDRQAVPDRLCRVCRSSNHQSGNREQNSGDHRRAFHQQSSSDRKLPAPLYAVKPLATGAP